MTKSIERRYLPVAELRVENRDSAPLIMGYAAKFDSLSHVLSEEGRTFRERIALGAFDGVLEVCDCRALIDHNPEKVLGRNKSGTLRLFQDEIGLRVEIDPANTSYAADLMACMERGDIDQMSFGFKVAGDSWSDGEDYPVRTIESIEDLFDVSVVTYPAYEETSAALRSLEAWERSKPRHRIENAKKYFDLIAT